MTSNDLAAQVHNKAKEIAAAMAVYPRLPEVRETLVGAVDLLVSELTEQWVDLLNQVEKEVVEEKRLASPLWPQAPRD